MTGSSDRPNTFFLPQNSSVDSAFPPDLANQLSRQSTSSPSISQSSHEDPRTNSSMGELRTTEFSGSNSSVGSSNQSSEDLKITKNHEPLTSSLSANPPVPKPRIRRISIGDPSNEQSRQLVPNLPVKKPRPSSRNSFHENSIHDNSMHDNSMHNNENNEDEDSPPPLPKKLTRKISEDMS